jgi:demethylmenaquinone methyltransferase/2-methoxy-6-polyprenyl-1,4-benzoquinol methylase
MFSNESMGLFICWKIGYKSCSVSAKSTFLRNFMSEKIQSMFADIAPTYDKANHLLSFNKDIQWRKDSVKQMLKEGFEPKMVLDLCAGTGDFALAVKEQVPTAKVVMADFAKPMLR